MADSLFAYVRGFVLGCRLGMPGVVIFGTAWGFLGHPFVGLATTLIGMVGTTLAWAIKLERLR